MLGDFGESRQQYRIGLGQSGMQPSMNMITVKFGGVPRGSGWAQGQVFSGGLIFLCYQGQGSSQGNAASRTQRKN